MNITPLIQLLLTILGFAIPDEERQNGELGDGTRKAVGQFQQLLGLPTTDEPDEETTRAIIVLTNQHLLTLLGFEINDDEQWRALAGDSTQEAIRLFQQQRGDLEITGELDDRTQEALQEQAGNGRFTVTGKVADSTGAPFIACAVQAWDEIVATGALRSLGNTRPAADGSYAIEYSVRQIRELGKLRADLVVTAQDDGGARRAQAGPFQPAPVRASVNLVVDPVPAPPAEWLVRGQVVDASGPLNNIQVTVFDRDLFFRRGGQNTGQQLGSGPIQKLSSKNEDGWFEFTYATADFAAGDIPVDGVTTPDLIFALSRDGQSLDKFQIYRLPDGKIVTEETQVSADDLILGIQARKVEEVRIVVEGGKPKQEISEYERLIQAIEPLLPQRAPAGADAAQIEALVGAAVKLFDEEKYRDISFVARETGFDTGLVEALVTAFALAAVPFQNQLPASVFFGLARTRGVSDVTALGRLSSADLRLALQNASAGDTPLIPPFEPAERLDETVQVIRDVLARYLPAHRPQEGAPSLADLVGDDLPNPDDQATLWRTFSDHMGTPEEFWVTLHSQPGFEDPNTIAKVQYSFQLGLLAQNNITLVNAIRAKHPEVATIRELAFHLDTKEKWSALLDDPDLAIPDDVPGKPEERKANYAASLARAIQIAHPSAAVANMVASLPPEQLANAQPAVARFLTDAVQTANFDLVADRIDELVAQHGERLLDGIEAKDRLVVIDQVKRLQRLFRLSTGPESMKALLEAGFSSARELAELPPAIAMELLDPVLNETTARLVLNRARNISAAAIHHYVFLNDAINGDIPGGSI